MRLKATIAYDGTAYYGWQIQQPHLPTIQSEVEKCLETIGRFPVRVHGAGRTDTGVHAYGQIAHFDWENQLAAEKLLLAMNAVLPEDIRVLSLVEVDPLFHARFDAVSKIYLYRVDLSRIYNPFTYRYALHFRKDLDVDLLFRCAELHRGKSRFFSFSGDGNGGRWNCPEHDECGNKTGISESRHTFRRCYVFASRRMVFCGRWCAFWWEQCSR